jgi:enoyl-CoA hydratase
MHQVGLHVIRRDGVLTVRIDRAEKRNALSRQLLAEIGSTFRDHAEDASLKMALLTGAGDRSFAAGGDLRDLSSVQGADAAEVMARDAKHALQAIREFPVPVIAGLNGDALGGGAELAIACDMRVAASHARIGFIQGKLAIASAWGGGVDLMRLVGPSRALRLLTRSEMLDPEQAMAIGLVDDAASGEETLDQAIERFIEPMRQQAPQVMRAFKALAIEAKNAGRIALDDIETIRFGGVWAHPDHDAAVEAILNKARRA